MPVTAITTFLPIVEPQNRPNGIPRSELENAHRLAHRLGALAKNGALLRREPDFDDLLEPLSPKLARDAEEKAGHSVLALEPGGARQHTLLVANDRFRHLHRRGRGRVVRGARLQKFDDLGAAVARSDDDRVERL